jgi:hypothetical protein
MLVVSTLTSLEEELECAAGLQGRTTLSMTIWSYSFNLA